MKLKKFLVTICAACLLLTGCNVEKEQTSSHNSEDSQPQTVKLGMITHLNATEKQMKEYLSKLQENTQDDVVTHVPVFYDNFNFMFMGINADDVDEISTYQSVAEYVLAKNSKYEIANVEWLKGLTDNFCFAVRAEDKELKAELDKTIKEMKSDGSLDKLINDYINNVNKQNPPKVEIPKTEGAPTIKVGVTGDLPPLDLILPDDSPAGFNTALLAEIAKRLKKNIEIIQIDSGARAAALNSEQIDVIFWVIIPDGDKLPSDIDKPNGIESTEAYFKDNIAHLNLKN